MKLNKDDPVAGVKILGEDYDTINDNPNIKITHHEDSIEYEHLKTGARLIVNIKNSNGMPKNICIDGKKL